MPTIPTIGDPMPDRDPIDVANWLVSLRTEAALDRIARALHELVQAVDAVADRDELRIEIRDGDAARRINARFRFRRDPAGTSSIAFLLDRTEQPAS